MRVLAITKVFPNAVVPLDEPHIRQQYAALGRHCELEVLASIPWFPGISFAARWSYAGRVAQAPRHERIEDLEVYHPRFFQIPKFGLPLQAAFYAGSLLPALYARRGRFDAILATWAFPDGVAAVALGKLLGLPVVVEVIGSDINVVAELPAARRNLRWGLPRAAAVVAVSRQLGAKVEALGVDPGRIEVIPTGVNPEVFHPRERRLCREQLGLPVDGPLMLYVGRIERAKGVFDLLDAFAKVSAEHPEVRLALIGGGSADEELGRRATVLGPRVIIGGQRPISEVPLWLGACDLLTLPSWAEGTPNVILEALACGRRVVASEVGGIPDVVRNELQGTLVPPKAPEALAAALLGALRQPYDPAAVAATEGVLTLDENARRLLAVLERSVAG